MKQAHRPSLHQQRGAALLAIILLAVLGLLAFMLARMQNENRPQVRQQEAQQRLGEARDALVASAARDWCANPLAGETPQWRLPCPAGAADDGAAAMGCSSAVLVSGRLPWRELGIAPLRDAAGECFWYQREANQVFPAPAAGTVIARIIAPGAALPGQTRPGAQNGACGNHPTEADYLEAAAAPNRNDLVLEVTYALLVGAELSCPPPALPGATGCGDGSPAQCSSAGQALAGQANGNNNGCRQLPGNQVSAFCQAQLDIINDPLNGCSAACQQAASDFTTPPCIASLNPPQCQAVINALNQP